MRPDFENLADCRAAKTVTAYEKASETDDAPFLARASLTAQWTSRRSWTTAGAGRGYPGETMRTPRKGLSAPRPRV